MFSKVLIANRGEIAVRIIRACREMGIRTVAVYSEADKDALHTQLADESVCIGKAQALDSYLNMERILSATVASGAEAIHPGFGFLSENSKFAELCDKCNITFIGPSAEVIEKTGNKQEARNTMIKAGVPVIPGTKEPVMDAGRGKEIAASIGYPVMIKAALGGGGKGMRAVYDEKDFYHPTVEVTKQENEVLRLLEATDIPFGVVKKTVLTAARLRFSCCDENPAEAYTELLKAAFESYDGKFDVDYLKLICKGFRANIDGTVTVILKNGAEIRSTEVQNAC